MKPTGITLIATFLLEILAPCLSHASADGETGRSATAVYRTDGQRTIATGKVAGKPPESARNAEPESINPGRIQYDDMDVLMLGDDGSYVNMRLREEYSRVRITARSSSGRPITGRFQGIIRDTLMLASNYGYERIPLSSIDKFEVSLGRANHADTGMQIGLAMGLGFTVTFGAIGLELEQSFFDFLCLGALMSIPVVLVPTLIGAVIRTERWEKVLPQRLNLSVAPTHGRGIGAAVRYQF